MSLPRGTYASLPTDQVVVVDTETTGLFPFGKDPSGNLVATGADRLCSIAAVKVQRIDHTWTVVDSWSARTNPDRPIHPMAQKVNGFTWMPGAPRWTDGMENLVYAGSVSAALRHLDRFAAGCFWVCHNAAFDLAMIDAERLRAGMPLLHARVACTKQGYADMLGLGRLESYIPGTSLNALAKTLHADLGGRVGRNGRELHGALVDAQITASCFTTLDRLGWMRAESTDDAGYRKTLG